MEEHRSIPRRRVLKAATISFHGGAISCAVRNFSEHGALLDVTSPIGIPDTFSLVMEGGSRHCRVVWRKEKRIGVRFTASHSDEQERET